mgnify:CR=1 FL=1
MITKFITKEQLFFCPKRISLIFRRNLSLKKAGFVYLEQGNKKAAKKAFETIKNDYPTSVEAQDIEKYIAIAAE